MSDVNGVEKNCVLDTERKFFVEVVFWFPRVRKSDVIESENGWRQFVDVFKVEAKSPPLFNLFNETGCLHFVDDLLLRLCLADKIGVSTSGRNESDGMTSANASMSLAKPTF